MQIKKTVGNLKLGGKRKDYVIHTTCGERYYAKALRSQGYECGGMSWQSLKELKTHISNGGFDEDDDEPTETSTGEGLDLWDCVHPCAWLCLVPSISHEALETLGNYGWLDCVGRPDIARAEREIKRVQNLTGAQSDDN